MNLLDLASRLELAVRDARRSPLEFYRHAFRDGQGGPVIVKDFHRTWFKLFQTKSQLLIEAPRGSAKTTAVLAYILWRLGHNPNLRIKLICGDDSEAAKRLAEIKQHIQDPRGYPTFFNACFPHVRLNKNAKNDHLNLTLEREIKHKDYTIEARGVLSSGTGSRADIIVLDDCVTYKNAIQEPSLRPKVTQKVLGDWFPTKAPKDYQIISIFTPWHDEDVNSHLTSLGSPWYHYRIAHGTPEDPFHSIFPEVFPSSFLREEYKTLKPIEYARAYLCKRISSHGQIIDPDDLHLPSVPLPLDLEPNQVFSIIYPDLPAPRSSIRILSVDPSGGRSRTASDFMGFTLLEAANSPTDPEDPTKTLWPAPYHIHVHDTYQSRMTTAQAAKHTVVVAQQFKPDIVLIEAQGAVSLDQWIQKEAPHLPVVPWPAKRSKADRLRESQPLFAHRPPILTFTPRVVLPQSKQEEEFYINIENLPVPALRPLRRQILNFPTTHDDALDSLTQALNYASRYFLEVPTTSEDEDEAPDLQIEVYTI
ncbi:MAG: hypothetical protein D6812_11885 [Deltaproteobacteria bacterium]|nr:MAG: hypothetical protein D6812_11885 [Deltaproteobacteria bacterium]